MAMRRERREGPRPPLDEAALERFALRYAERYATTRAKLAFYLQRKLRERGWAHVDRAPPVEEIIRRMAELGYVDDRGFAEQRGAALTRRGFGERRVTAALRAAGIQDDDAAPVREAALTHAWEAAVRFAERRKIGPFAAEYPDRPAREKALVAFLRAGHPLDLARRLVAARPGDAIEANDT